MGVWIVKGNTTLLQKNYDRDTESSSWVQLGITVVTYNTLEMEGLHAGEKKKTGSHYLLSTPSPVPIPPFQEEMIKATACFFGVC